MAQARRASALLLRRCSFLAADCMVAPPANRARSLASLSLVSFSKERTTGSRERPGWRVRAGAVVVGGTAVAAAAVTGFMSLLPPPVTCCEALQQIDGSESVQQSAEAIVATEETLDGNKDAPRITADTVTQLLAELRAICDEDRVVVDVDEREFHAKPWNTYHSVDAIPDIVVNPESQEEVVAIVRACAKFKVPLTPFAGGTSLEGHTMTLQRGVSIDMNSMKKVKELHLEDMDVIVEPGIGWMELNEYLKPHGLFFPLDPGPGATIGGMCATRCSGSMAVRYGTMRDNVISLKAVVANGDLVKTGARARKSAAGYDLTRLLIGSEGTLGVITEVTLRLQKIPEATVVAMCNFKSVGDAAAVAIATMHSGIQGRSRELSCWMR